MQLTPSITALATCFVLSDSAAASVSDPLRATYETWVEKHNAPLAKTLRYLVRGGDYTTGGGTVHSPDFQRRHEFRSRLDELVDACAAWTTSSLPGSFASGASGTTLPHAVLLLSEVVAPNTEEARDFLPFRVVGLDRSYRAWTTDEWDAVRMVIGSSSDADAGRLTFSAVRADLGARAGASEPDPLTNWSLAQDANDRVPGLLARWALSLRLDEYHRQLARSRDSVGAPGRARPVGDAKMLRDLARRDLYDLRLSAREIDGFAQSRWRYARNVLEMKREPLGPGDDVDLVDALRDGQQIRAGQIDQEAELLLATLTTAAGLTQVISNLRLQRAAIVTAVGSAIIAALAIIVAVRLAG